MVIRIEHQVNEPYLYWINTWRRVDVIALLESLNARLGKNGMPRVNCPNCGNDQSRISIDQDYIRCSKSGCRQQSSILGYLLDGKSHKEHPFGDTAALGIYLGLCREAGMEVADFD